MNLLAPESEIELIIDIYKSESEIEFYQHQNVKWKQ